MSQNIVYSDANTIGVNSPLFTFDSVYDTDFGLLIYIFREYFDTDIFSKDFFEENSTVDKMVYSLANREQENPLLLAMNDKTNYDLADDLYSEFYNKKYKEILTYSMPTAVSDLIQIIEYEGGFNVGFIVDRQEEIDFLQAINEYSKANYINANSVEDRYSIAAYNQVYFKSCNDRFMNNMDLLDKIYQKSIYIPRYPFNLDEENNIYLTPSVLKLQMNRCVFYKYDIYDFTTEEEFTDDEMV